MLKKAVRCLLTRHLHTLPLLTRHLLMNLFPAWTCLNAAGWRRMRCPLATAPSTCRWGLWVYEGGGSCNTGKVLCVCSN